MSKKLKVIALLEADDLAQIERVHRERFPSLRDVPRAITIRELLREAVRAHDAAAGT